MKRSLLVVLCSMVAAPALAMNIQVTAPGNGASWAIGSVQSVAWTFAGLPASTKVKIILRKEGGGNLGMIAVSVPIGSNGQGSFAWTAGILADAPQAGAGEGYYVRVKTEDGSLSGDSGMFSLTSGGSGVTVQPPSVSQLGSDYSRVQKTVPAIPTASGAQPRVVRVTEPAAGAQLSPSGGYAIRWELINIPETGVSLALLRDGQPAGAPAGSTTDPHEFLWDLKLQPPDPGTYKVAVETSDKAHRGLSGAFAVLESGTVEPQYPGQGMMFFNGSSVEVKWKRKGNLQKVDLILVKAGQTEFQQTLAANVDAKLEKASVVLNPGEYGQYSIGFKIVCSDTITTVHSGTFTIQMGQ